MLFAVEEGLPALVARLMSEAPASFAPMMVIAEGLETVAATRFEGQLEYLRTRDAIIQSDEGQRELRKLSVLSEAIRLGFLNRGVAELTSALAAQIAVTVFSVALTRWIEEGSEQELTEIVAEVSSAVRSVAADSSTQLQQGPTPPAEAG